MSGSLADYLAKNYLNADPITERPKKKRKKTKATDTNSGLIIVDDDSFDLRKGTNTAQDDDDAPTIDTSGTSAEFRSKAKSSWKSIRAASGNNNEQEAADAILASAAAERDARAAEEADDNMEGIDDDGPRMESGIRAGLQTAAQTAAMVKVQEKKRKTEEALFRQASGGGKEQQTIYRDASGRIINVAMKRAEARRAEEEAREKEIKAKEAMMGDVQRQQREERRQELQDVRAMPLARMVDDQDLNDDQKAQSRWNDPAAQFLTKKAETGASVTGKPLYRGSFQPNRYGIRPGHRWDGVDRANGFEKDWFAARNKKSRIASLEYQWQMDA
ncbi:hypothetical protein N7495_009944 [Penicillium taxi]|uniref:uncharacterized protein n=1 Tax=Penicillium taxi TaxID=168475 RepID=UPI0025458FAA|nr:uncharacterized protein N7495_009944 [Penicillium taxi]KAJ5885434.1 hypothetical protein N7495_009944 [Penicillium taxi]